MQIDCNSTHELYDQFEHGAIVKCRKSVAREWQDGEVIVENQGGRIFVYIAQNEWAGSNPSADYRSKKFTHHWMILAGTNWQGGPMKVELDTEVSVEMLPKPLQKPFQKWLDKRQEKDDKFPTNESLMKVKASSKLLIAGALRNPQSVASMTWRASGISADDLQNLDVLFDKIFELPQRNNRTPSCSAPTHVPPNRVDATFAPEGSFRFTARGNRSAVWTGISERRSEYCHAPHSGVDIDDIRSMDFYDLTEDEDWEIDCTDETYYDYEELDDTDDLDVDLCDVIYTDSDGCENHLDDVRCVEEAYDAAREIEAEIANRS